MLEMKQWRSISVKGFQFIRKEATLPYLCLLLSILTLWTFVAMTGIQDCTGNTAKAKQPESAQLSAQARLDSTVGHYWDYFDYADASQLTPEIAEQLLVDYIVMLPYATADTVKASVGTLVGKAAVHQQAYDWFANQFDRYLYDPNSPFRHEELYAVVLEQIIACPRVDDVYKVRPRNQLEDINCNRLDMVASDLTYTEPGGKRGKLYGIGSDYTLLFFYDPDCSDCKRMKEYLQALPELVRLQGYGRLQVLALYPNENLLEWKNYCKNIPQGWINGHDAEQAINKKRVYALRAIPSLYLLDKNKRVLLKDCTPKQLEQMLQTIG